MRRAHKNGFSPADDMIYLLAASGFYVEDGDAILDFGCGSGALAYEFKDLGFDARGFDLHDYVDYRSEDDRSMFEFLGEKRENRSDQRFEPETFRLPYPDDMFDLIFSTTVIEHVMNLEPVIHELARITKPGGVGLHVFPLRESVVEPHIYVPFAGRIQSPAWFNIWAFLGIRNEFQGDLSFREVAKRNLQYAQTGLNYKSERELMDISGRYFSSVRSATRLQNARREKKLVWGRRLQSLKDGTPFRVWAQTQPMGALIMSKGKPQP